MSVARFIAASLTPPQKKYEPGQAMKAIIGNLDSLLEAISERAQYTALRGVLAVEAGDLAKAERLFRRALAESAVLDLDFPYRGMVQEYLQKLTRFKETTARTKESPPKVGR